MRFWGRARTPCSRFPSMEAYGDGDPYHKCFAIPACDLKHARLPVHALRDCDWGARPKEGVSVTCQRSMAKCETSITEPLLRVAWARCSSPAVLYSRPRRPSDAIYRFSIPDAMYKLALSPRRHDRHRRWLMVVRPIFKDLPGGPRRRERSCWFVKFG